MGLLSANRSRLARCCRKAHQSEWVQEEDISRAWAVCACHFDQKRSRIRWRDVGWTHCGGRGCSVAEFFRQIGPSILTI